MQRDSQVDAWGTRETERQRISGKKQTERKLKDRETERERQTDGEKERWMGKTD